MDRGAREAGGQEPRGRTPAHPELQHEALGLGGAEGVVEQAKGIGEEAGLARSMGQHEIQALHEVGSGGWQSLEGGRTQLLLKKSSSGRTDKQSQASCNQPMRCSRL